MDQSPDSVHVDLQGDDELSPAITQVEELLRAFATTLRSYRLYAGNGPVLDRFGEVLREKFAALWDYQPILNVVVAENQILCDDVVVYNTGGESGDLAFLLFKDGIREITFLEGFEQDEVRTFLSILARAPQIRPDEDDLVTLLWEADLKLFRYSYVEAGSEREEGTADVSTASRPVDPDAIRSEAQAPPESTAVSAEDFQEARYFLDAAELRRIADEVRREEDRDLWKDVVNAVFDRLEDGSDERQIRIINVLGELLPSLLASGKADDAAVLLGDLADLVGRGDVFSPAVLREVRDLFAQLGSPEAVQQLVMMLELQNAESSEGLAALLSYFPPEAIAPLMRAGETAVRPNVRRALSQLIERLVTANRDHLAGLLNGDDPVVVAGAARWIGRLGAGAAVGSLVELLHNPEPAVRRAAIEALQELRASAAAESIVPLIGDPAVEVRIAAARALGSIGYSGARAPLEAAVTSKHLRSADRGEKVAFFEAFGRIAGPEGVALLDRTLNGKRWLGRSESSETRACAAVALAQIRSPAARTALDAAVNDHDPVVRTAVHRALKEVG
ncbi:MAG TPA: HEAT repeat domain-containing protein [Longimicrobiaceae bacterium]|nr:HEAT repeat domain-containing protein [Longimicrobiaceae bacterium]